MEKFHIKTRIYKSGKIEIGVSYKSRRVGTIIFTDIDQPAFYILYLNVADRYMKKGIGSTLLREAFRQALNKGCKAVSLYVRTDNHNAIKLYTKFGFFISMTTFRKDLGDHYLMSKEF